MARACLTTLCLIFMLFALGQTPARAALELKLSNNTPQPVSIEVTIDKTMQPTQDLPSTGTKTLILPDSPTTFTLRIHQSTEGASLDTTIEILDDGAQIYTEDIAQDPGEVVCNGGENLPYSEFIREYEIGPDADSYLVKTWPTFMFGAYGKSTLLRLPIPGEITSEPVITCDRRTVQGSATLLPGGYLLTADGVECWDDGGASLMFLRPVPGAENGGSFYAQATGSFSLWSNSRTNSRFPVYITENGAILTAKEAELSTGIAGNGETRYFEGCPDTVCPADTVNHQPDISFHPPEVIVGETFYIPAKYNCDPGQQCTDERRELRYTLDLLDNLDGIPSSESPGNQAAIRFRAMALGTARISLLTFNNHGHPKETTISINIIEGEPRFTEGWLMN